MKRPSFLPAHLADHVPKILPIALPLVLAVSMALMFRQPAMLMFGLVGPLLAFSNSWGRKRDQALHAQQQEDRDRERQDHQQRAQALKIDAWRNEKLRAYPAVSEWLHNPLWRPEAHTADVSVRLGLGAVTPPVESGIDHPIPSVPLTIPLHSSLAVVGSGLDAVATWRAVACQAIAIISATGHTGSGHISVAGVWARNADLPHHLDIPHPSGEATTRWCFVDTATQVPPHATWVVVVGGNGAAQLFHRGVVLNDGLQPDVVTFAQSRWVRARLVDSEAHSDVLAQKIQSDDRGALWAELASDQSAIDLVAQGPHTLVWGKTGSGKSVLLQRLLGSLCARYSPSQLALVGIDFKGGATLAPLMVHPHAAGLLTDLTSRSTTRVTASLRAEILRREQLFADHQVATWQELPGDLPCPRVVIVVDEAGVVAHEAPELMEVLSDVASRGRSLGLHLVVSTQRPQHLPRNIIANCALRLCLPVTDTDEASQYAPDIPRHLLHSLRHSPPGTVLIPNPGGTYSLATVDTSPGDVSWPGHTQRSLWCQELPDRITADDIAQLPDVTNAGYLLGLADYPSRQSQEPWVYEPRRHGPLVVVGESGSGHTHCLSHLASQAEDSQVEVVWGSRVASVLAWQLLTLTEAAGLGPPRLLILDRLDRILRTVSSDGHSWFMDAIETVAAQLSERGDGSAAVVSVAPGSNPAATLSRWNATRALLRHRDSTQWALAGGVPAVHDVAAPAGRAIIGGVAVQWCHPRLDTPPVREGAVVERAPEGVLVITPTTPHTERYVVIGLSEAESRWQELKHAITHGSGVVCSDIAPQLMRQWCGPGYTTPPVVAAWPYGWHFHPEGVRLVLLGS